MAVHCATTHNFQRIIMSLRYTTNNKNVLSLALRVLDVNSKLETLNLKLSTKGVISGLILNNSTGESYVDEVAFFIVLACWLLNVGS